MLPRTKPCAERKTESECSGKSWRAINCIWNTRFGCLPPDSTALASGKEGGKNTASQKSSSSSSKKHATRPEPCEVPACNSKKDMMRRMMGGNSSTRSDNKQMTGKGAGQSVEKDSRRVIECPADREELGQQTWTLLHTMAAFYPDEPTETDKNRARNFIEALSHMYPCTHCAYAFREELADESLNGVGAPKVDSRVDFSQWMCRAHNAVNAQLGKPEYPCDIKSLDRRWKTGAAQCWEGDNDKERLI
eukprot:g579.t1